jgi:phage replication-related protein YjqB (UPF0714/DUF867 family)
VSFTELLAAPGVTEEVTLAGRFGFLAFHGGLEGGTENVAEAAATAAGASYYGVIQPPTMRWHIPSHRVGIEPSPALTAFLHHVEVGVAVHGYGRPERPRAILLGGSNRILASALAACLGARVSGFEVVDNLDDMPVEMRGLHPYNPVNLIAGGGVQLELPPGARGAAWRLAERSTTCVPVAGLVDALAETAAAWLAQAVSAQAVSKAVSTAVSTAVSAQAVSKVPPARQ